MAIKRPESPLTIAGHLDELRYRLIFCICIVMCLAVPGFLFAPNIISFLKLPSSGIIETFIITRPSEPVVIYFKVAFFFSLIFSFPALLYHLWKFVKPAFNAPFTVIPWAAGVFALFLTGVLFSYKIVLPMALKVLLSMSSGIATPMITLQGYISFVLALLLLGGVIFEMPAAAALLTKINVLSPGLMRKKRKEAFFTLCVLAAVLTPTTDAFTMLVFLAPMVLLYEISVIVSAFLYKEPEKEYGGDIYENV